MSKHSLLSIPGLASMLLAFEASAAETLEPANEMTMDESWFEDKFVQGGLRYTYWATATAKGTRESVASEKAEISLPGGWVAKDKPKYYKERKGGEANEESEYNE